MKEGGRLAILGDRRRDLLWFVGPGIAAAIVGTLIGIIDPRPSGGEVTVGLWIVGVLLVDVAHVWSSLYRTYLDPVARHHHARLLWTAPLAALALGIVLHLQSSILFWSVLAYIAIFHFIKQHVGFAMIYARAGRETAFDRRIVEATIWASTAGPVLWWHAHLPTHFAWFMPGDLLAGAPAWLGDIALWGQVPIWLVFIARRVALHRRDLAHPMVTWLVLVPAINWHLGIVVFDDDRIFTITNVFLHGIPYLALVWIAGGRARVERSLATVTTPTWALAAATFYGLVAALAVVEEALWDRLVWHDQPELFGHAPTVIEPESVAMAIIVAALTLPQATHYILDRYIWRVGPRNPELATQLGFGSSSTRDE